MTPERRNWIKRTRIGIFLFLAFPIGEALGGLDLFDLLLPLVPVEFTSVFGNPVDSLRVIILLTSLLVVLYAAVFIVAGIPRVDKWFFDEIKFRATPELMKFRPDVNLAELWKQVDT